MPFKLVNRCDNLETTCLKHFRTERQLVTAMPRTSKSRLYWVAFLSLTKMYWKKAKNLLTKGEMKIRLSMPLSLAV